LSTDPQTDSAVTARDPLGPDPAGSPPWPGWVRKAFALVLVGVRFELGMWRSLARWVLRRPDVRPGETALAYRSQLVAPVLGFFVLSLVEVVALDVLVPWGGAWERLRLPLLVLGAWGAVLMLGVLAGLTVHPHVVGAAGLRVRYGAGLDVHVPWDAVAGARELRGSRDGRTVQLDGHTLYVQISRQFTVEVTLERPVPVTLSRGREVEITAVRFHADEPAALVAAVRTRLAAGAGGSS
jgi:hypothetical protein